MLLLGVDVGGTFTDIAMTNTDSNVTRVHKVASTPEDSSKAVLHGVREICAAAGAALKDIDHIFHGTTVATNAALQHRGARAGLITNQGFPRQHEDRASPATAALLHPAKHPMAERAVPVLVERASSQSLSMIASEMHRIISDIKRKPASEADSPATFASRDIDRSSTFADQEIRYRGT